MTVSRFACALWVLALAEPRARADITGVSIDPTHVTRTTSDGSTPYGCPARPGTNGCIVDGNAQGIGFQDCIDDSLLVVPVTVLGTPAAGQGGDLEVWAGTGDCTQPGQTKSSTEVCWPVAAPLGFSNPSTFEIHVADIAAHVGQTTLPTSYSADSPPGACVNGAATSGEATVNLFFMWYPTAAPSHPVHRGLPGEGEARRAGCLHEREREHRRPRARRDVGAAQRSDRRGLQPLRAAGWTR